MHILFILLNTAVSFLLRLPTEQKKTIIILASQKTLSQAVAATVFLPDGVGKEILVAFLVLLFMTDWTFSDYFCISEFVFYRLLPNR